MKAWSSDTFCFLGLQNHCRQWLQPWNKQALVPLKESYDKSRQHIKKHRHHIANKGQSSQNYVFFSSHVWMWKLNYKKFEHCSICAFELWCWRKLLKVPWTAKRSNQSILKEINLEYSLEGWFLKLNLQHFGHLIWRTDSYEKTLMLRKTEGKERRRPQGTRWLESITSSMTRIRANSRTQWMTEYPGMLQSTGSQSVGPDLVTKP